MHWNMTAHGCIRMVHVRRDQHNNTKHAEDERPRGVTRLEVQLEPQH